MTPLRHFEEVSVSVFGFMATAGAEALQAPHWLVNTIAGLTALHILTKLVVAVFHFADWIRIRRAAQDKR